VEELMTFEPIDWPDDDDDDAEPEPTTHPCPGCGQNAPGHLYACRACTATLPPKLRRAANRAWRQGGPDAPLQAATQHLARPTLPSLETATVSTHLDRITR
jgi:tRNA(Ile2) C34 agmatinyltransferase TiaS